MAVSDLAYELNKRFSGGWNSLILVLLVIICLRFSGAEWKDEVLGIRLLYSLYILFAVAGLGIVFASAKVLLIRFGHHTYGYTYSDAIAGGLKYGVNAGTIIVFAIGILMVDNYLGPVKDILDVALKKIGG